MVDRWLPCDMAVLIQDSVYSAESIIGTKCKMIAEKMILKSNIQGWKYDVGSQYMNLNKSISGQK